MRWVRIGIIVLGAFQVGYAAMYQGTTWVKWMIAGIGAVVIILGLTFPRSERGR